MTQKLKKIQFKLIYKNLYLKVPKNEISTLNIVYITVFIIILSILKALLIN